MTCWYFSRCLAVSQTLGFQISRHCLFKGRIIYTSCGGLLVRMYGWALQPPPPPSLAPHLPSAKRRQFWPQKPKMCHDSRVFVFLVSGLSAPWPHPLSPAGHGAGLARGQGMLSRTIIYRKSSVTYFFSYPCTVQYTGVNNSQVPYMTNRTSLYTIQKLLKIS